MTGTTRLALPYIAAAQAGKEVTHNDDLDRIDARFDNIQFVDLSAGNGSVTLAQLQACYLVQGFGHTAARNLTLAAFEGGRMIQNAGTAEITVKLGSASIVLPAKSLGIFYGDGTTNGLFLMAGPFGGLAGSFAATTLTGDTSGTALCVMPRQGAYDKEVIIYLSNYQHAGTAQFYTFPTAFAHTPVALADVEPPSTIIASKVTLSNAMGAGVTGWIILKGF